jgi:hypothetical protein
MSAKNHFVIWKGIRTGPFTKEELEREFAEGRIGMVRTVQSGEARMSGFDFMANVETIRREDELKAQLAHQARMAEAARLEAERREEEYQRQLEEERQRLHEEKNKEKNRLQDRGKTIPPPIPETNPWAPDGGGIPNNVFHPPMSPSRFAGSWWDGSGPVIMASLFILICLLSGQIFREATGLVALGLATVLLVRRRIVPGSVLIAAGVLCYGIGFLLSHLIHDYLTKNYPN